MNQDHAEAEVQQKHSIKDFFKSIGPGIIFALTALGAGDLVDSSVSGSHYGYALMWVLALALLVRFLIVNLMARFDMCNQQGLTLLQGYAKIGRFFPWFFAIYSIFLGHMLNAIMIKGCAQALGNMTSFNNPMLWAVVTVAVSLFIGGRNVYKKLETVMKILLAVMTLCFLGLAVACQPNPLEIVHGTFGFELPKGTGMFGALMITVSLVGSVAGSLTNFLYPHSCRAKGWVNASYKKMQRNELLFSIIMLVILNLAMWIVGAEILRPAGIEVKSLDDISKALSMTFGPAGSFIFYAGVFGALYSTVLGVATGFTAIAVENIHILRPERGEKYNHVAEDDPIYRYLSLFFLITPLVWSLPGTPDFVVITLVANVFNTVALPAIAVGLLFITNKKDFIGKYRNNWFENVVLSGTVVLAVWGAIKIAMGFFGS